MDHRHRCAGFYTEAIPVWASSCFREKYHALGWAMRRDQVLMSEAGSKEQAERLLPQGNR